MSEGRAWIDEITPGEGLDALIDFAGALTNVAGALVEILRPLLGDPLPPHYKDGRRRRRNHRGKLPKLAHVPHLPPQWQAEQRRKRRGALAELSGRKSAPTEREFARFQADSEQMFADLRAWAESQQEGDLK